MQTPESQFNNVNNPEYLTIEGLDKLKKELEERRERRQEIVKHIEFAREQGDLTENTEYDSAKNEQGENESRIMDIEDILSRAVIISKKEKTADIRLCSLVSLQKEGSEEIEKYSLVGSEEADPLAGKISHESPLGASLLGKRKGENIKVLTPNGKITYTIIDVG
jgi:transcription elongation factor GreA